MASGVRVFVEGFRVLPYGESGNDWLTLDRDATARARGRFLSLDQDDPLAELLPESGASRDEGLLVLPNKHYFGAVFLTQDGAHPLRTLVNREGFVPDAPFETLVRLVRIGIDLLTRTRAAASEKARDQRRSRRARKGSDAVSAGSVLHKGIADAQLLAKEARGLIAAGSIAKAAAKLDEVLQSIAEAESAAAEMIGESRMLRVLASVGTQMAAFIHEINALVGTAEAVDHALRRIRVGKVSSRNKEQAELLGNLKQVVGDLRRNLERQASYLVDVVTPDARRRRVRQPLAEQFDTAARLVATAADARGISIANGIPATLQSPPMFRAELTTVFANLLTNAVKAAGKQGRVRATARRLSEGIALRVENTGDAVSPEDSERWFEPFESTTTSVDAVLGQGMGLGLPITRSVLAEYGGSIRFVTPSSGYSTALEMILPVKG